MSPQSDQADKRSSREIEREIEQTRSQLSDTVEGIQNRLSPNSLVDDAINYIRTNKELRRNVATTVRDNPVPLLLMGIGLIWLVVSGASGARQRTGIRQTDTAGIPPGVTPVGARTGGEPGLGRYPEGRTPEPYGVGNADRPLSSASGEPTAPGARRTSEGPEPVIPPTGRSASTVGESAQTGARRTTDGPEPVIPPAGDAGGRNR